MTKENDEWRIASAPNAFVIPSDWFQDHYTQKLLYYFDPTASILVPEPIFVSADQLTGSLVKALLDGPGPALAEVVRTFVPEGLTPGLSVPVDETAWPPSPSRAIATRLTPETAKLLVYQFAWTLKQVPELTAFRITIGGEPVTMPGGAVNQFSVDLGSEYDPTDVQASNQLFAVDSGSLVTGDPTDLQPVTGPLGTYGGIESVGVDLDAKQAAAVTDGGTTLVVAPVTSVGTEQAPITTVLSEATKLLRPAWDFQRLWIVDRTADGARVSVLDPDQGLVPTPVTIDGITGRQVRDFIVSRDGTRFVAVVRGKEGDRLRISRIRQTFGRVAGATPSRNLAWSSGETERIRDIAWRSPTTVGVLHAESRQFTRFASVSVDGAAGPQLQEQTVLQNVATRRGVVTRREGALVRRRRRPADRPRERGRDAAADRELDPVRRLSPQAPTYPVVPAPRSCCDRRVLEALADATVDLLLGSRCVGCDRPGRLLCRRCADGLAEPARVAWPTPVPPGLVTAVDGGRVRRCRSGSGARPQGASHARPARTPRAAARAVGRRGPGGRRPGGASPRSWCPYRPGPRPCGRAGTTRPGRSPAARRASCATRRTTRTPCGCCTSAPRSPTSPGSTRRPAPPTSRAPCAVPRPRCAGWRDGVRRRCSSSATTC